MLHECLLSPEISTAYLSEVGHMSGRPLAIYSVAKGVKNGDSISNTFLPFVPFLEFKKTTSKTFFFYLAR